MLALAPPGDTGLVRDTYHPAPVERDGEIHGLHMQHAMHAPSRVCYTAFGHNAPGYSRQRATHARVRSASLKAAS